MASFVKWNRSPGTLTYFDSAAGTTLYDTDSRQKVYQGTTTTGKPPVGKPMPSNPYELNIQDYGCDVHWSYSYPGPPSKSIITYGPALPRGSTMGFSWEQLNPILNDAWARCYNGALERFNDQYRGNLDISIDLAESRQTIKMLRVVDQVEDLTKTFFKRWGPLKAPANAWLLYTYGIKPLASTIFGLAEENIRVIVNKVGHYKARNSEMLEPGPISLYLFNGWHNNLRTTGTGKASVTIGGNVCSPEVDPGRFSSLNPASIAWELMPYSFVVDWFFNLGSYLRSMETALLYDSQWRGGYVTRLWAYEGSIDHRYSGSNSYSSYTIQYGGKLKNVYIQRSILGSYPKPLLPSFGAELGSSRLLSAASLLAQFLGRRPIRGR